MPIKIPNDLPAVQTLADENIFAMTETRALHPCRFTDDRAVDMDIDVTVLS